MERPTISRTVPKFTLIKIIPRWLEQNTGSAWFNGALYVESIRMTQQLCPTKMMCAWCGQGEFKGLCAPRPHK